MHFIFNNISITNLTNLFFNIHVLKSSCFFSKRSCSTSYWGKTLSNPINDFLNNLYNLSLFLPTCTSPYRFTNKLCSSSSDNKSFILSNTWVFQIQFILYLNSGTTIPLNIFVVQKHQFIMPFCAFLCVHQNTLLVNLFVSMLISLSHNWLRHNRCLWNTCFHPISPGTAEFGVYLETPIKYLHAWFCTALMQLNSLCPHILAAYCVIH